MQVWMTKMEAKMKKPTDGIQSQENLISKYNEDGDDEQVSYIERNDDNSELSDYEIKI